jgi:hypothetical protein
VSSRIHQTGIFAVLCIYFTVSYLRMILYPSLQTDLLSSTWSKSQSHPSFIVIPQPYLLSDSAPGTEPMISDPPRFPDWPSSFPYNRQSCTIRYSSHHRLCSMSEDFYNPRSIKK